MNTFIIKVSLICNSKVTLEKKIFEQLYLLIKNIIYYLKIAATPHELNKNIIFI